MALLYSPRKTERARQNHTARERTYGKCSTSRTCPARLARVKRRSHRCNFCCNCLRNGDPLHYNKRLSGSCHCNGNPTRCSGCTNSPPPCLGLCGYAAEYKTILAPTILRTCVQYSNCPQVGELPPNTIYKRPVEAIYLRFYRTLRFAAHFFNPRQLRKPAVVAGSYGRWEL